MGFQSSLTKRDDLVPKLKCLMQINDGVHANQRKLAKNILRNLQDAPSENDTDFIKSTIRIELPGHYSEFKDEFNEKFQKMNFLISHTYDPYNNMGIFYTKGNCEKNKKQIMD